MDFGGESMNRPRGWLAEAPGWWTKEDWRIKVKFSKPAENIFFRSTVQAQPQLQDVVQHVTHVESTQNAKFGIEVLFDALVFSSLYLLQSINVALNSADAAGLTKAIESGHLPSLKYLRFHNDTGHGLFTFPDDIGDEAAKSLGVAIRSGKLKNLAELQLNQIGLTDEGLIALTDSFQEGVASLLPNLSFLDIGLNSFTTVGLLSLAGALSSGKLPNLTKLDISGNEFIRNEDAKIIGLAIRSGNVTNLAVGITNEGLITVEDSTIRSVANTMLKLCSRKLSSLIYLDISGNHKGIRNRCDFALTMRTGELKNLAELNLDQVGLTDECLTHLTDYFEDGVGSLLPNLSFLDIGNNSLTEAGMLSLAKALASEKFPSLRCLVISGNGVGDEGAKSFRQAIRSGKLKNLAQLKLKRIGLTDEGLIALTDSFHDGVASLLPNLSSLDIGRNSFTAVGLGSFAEALSSGKLPNLSSVDISGNDFIRNEGAKILGLAIRSGNLKNLAVGISNEGLIAVVDSFQEGVASVLRNLSSGKLFNLIYLDISRNHIGFDKTKSLGLAIQSGELKNLAELKLNRIRLTDKGLIALTDSFQDGVGSLLPNLSFLDIGNNSLTEAGLLSLAEALASEKLPSLKCLIISGNDVGDEGAKSFGLAIRSGTLKNLAKLKLERIGLTDEGLISLTDSFHDGVASLLPNLSSLDIGRNSFTAVGLGSFAEALSSGKLPNLSSLDLPQNHFTRNEGAKIIGLAIRSGNSKNLAVGISNEGLIAVVDSFQKGVASVLRNLSSGKLSNLIYLDISRNHIGFDETKSLGLAMQSGELKNLAELKLNHIGLTDEGLIALTDSFQDGMGSLLPNLSSLDLCFNSFTEKGLLSLSNALSSRKLPKLRCLDISANYIGEGAKSFGVAIRSGKLKNLAELRLKSIGLTNEGLIALTDSFQDGVGSLLPNLSFLDIRNNSLTEAGLLSLAEALASEKLPSLRCLIISGNDVGDEGAKSFGLAIRSGKLKNLAKLKLRRIGLTDEGLISLTDSFQEGVASLLPNLSSLDIGLNSFTAVGLGSFAEALSSGKLPNLSSVDISGNDFIRNEGAKILGLAIRSGNLKNLAVGISNESLIAVVDSFQQGMASVLQNLSSGKLSNLIYLDISGNLIGCDETKSFGLGIQSGELKNLAELKLNQIGLTDEGLIALTDFFQDGVGSLLPNLSFLDIGNNSLTEAGLLSLAEALAAEKLPSLRCLIISGNDVGDEGAKSFGLAIRSGKLKNLAKVELESVGLTDKGLIALTDFFQDGVASLVPNLSSLDLSFNSFTEVGLLSLGEALKSSQLNSLNVLDVRHSTDPSEEGALALVSAFVTNNCLTVDVKFEWYKFPELDRRREQLIERNHRHKDILAGLVTVPKVQATFGKVYLCGNPVVGKTTLRRTLQRSFWKSLFTWERRPHVEKRTRGIDVSQVLSKGNKPDEDPITLLVWDMAGQEDFHLVHNAFFPDLALAEGKATTFIVVCSSGNSLDDSMEQLEYWLRYIASSCEKTTENPRQVFVVMNKFKGGQKLHQHVEKWKPMLEGQRDTFKQYLKIQTDLFLADVRKFQQVEGLKRCLLEHSRSLLNNQEVPSICQAIQKNLSAMCKQVEKFPVLHWMEFMEQVVKQIQEPWPGHVIEAATKYLNEAGVVIYIDMEVVKLVVVDPNWLCREIIGNVFLPSQMASLTEKLFRKEVDQTTGSISISNFKKFFKYMKGEWNEAQVDDLIAILLWLGLCYKGKDANIFLPALIAENGTPGEPWCLPATVSHGRDQWVMGFSVRHQKNEVALAPISLWHRFQVDLAQFPKFNGERPDNDFVADKYFVTFVVDYMNVLIEVDASTKKPTFEEISILVKPSFERDDLAAPERKQCQVDLADILVERLLKLWSEVCPGVEYEHKIIWPWPASCSRPKDRRERNIEVAEVQKWVKERGMGTKMQWVVSPGNPITEDQLLSTKDKRKLGVLSISTNAGIKGHAPQVNDSVFELYKPDSNPKIQIVFFHGLQMEEYSDQHLSTWQSADGSTVWPQTWLVDDFPGAQVLSISYSGGLRYSPDGSLDMYLIGENLLSDLLRDGVGQVPHCPVVFVGHSIGGLVIKELCCRAHHEKVNRSQGHERVKLETFLTNIGGVFFYATPHRGSGVAEILSKEISSPLLTFFETLSKDAARLNSHFEEMCNAHYKHWLFAGLGEAVPTTLGPLKAGVAPRKYMVVPEASARTGDFNVVEGADHFSVCRPRSKTGRSFSKLRDFVWKIASKASDAEMNQPANP